MGIRADRFKQKHTDKDFGKMPSKQLAIHVHCVSGEGAKKPRDDSSPAIQITAKKTKTPRNYPRPRPDPSRAKRRRHKPPDRQPRRPGHPMSLTKIPAEN